MHRVLISLAAVTLAGAVATTATSAQAAPVGFEAAFGNTVRATYPDGRSQRYWFQPTGEWRAVGRRGTASSGKWTRKGDRVCLKQTKPFAGPFKYCTVFPADGRLGSSWPAKDAGGGKIRLSLERGGG